MRGRMPLKWVSWLKKYFPLTSFSPTIYKLLLDHGPHRNKSQAGLLAQGLRVAERWLKERDLDPDGAGSSWAWAPVKD